MTAMLDQLMSRLAGSASSCVLDQGLVSFVNPYSYAQLRQHPELLSAFDHVGIDGISMVWLVRAFLGRRVERASFDMTCLAPSVFQKLADEGKSVFLIGARDEEINAAQSRLSKAFPSLNIAAARPGYFATENDRSDCVQTIVDMSPDTVVVGMGAPLQEQFLVDLWQTGWRGAGYTCGGFFHQIAKKLDYYPAWADRYHLRWAYRIWDEPRLMRRYGIDYPRAAILFVNDAVRFRARRWLKGG